MLKKLQKPVFFNYCYFSPLAFFSVSILRPVSREADVDALRRVVSKDP